MEPWMVGLLRRASLGRNILMFVTVSIMSYSMLLSFDIVIYLLRLCPLVLTTYNNGMKKWSTNRKNLIL